MAGASRTAEAGAARTRRRAALRPGSLDMIGFAPGGGSFPRLSLEPKGRPARANRAVHAVPTRYMSTPLRIGKITIAKVEASIGGASGPLLPGQSFLSKFADWKIDNVHTKLILRR